MSGMLNRNPIQKLKKLLKQAGYASSSMSVARTLLEVVKGAEDTTLDPTNVNQLQFAMLLLRTGTRLPGQETQAAFRILANGKPTLNLIEAAARAEAPRADRKLRSPEAILRALRNGLLGAKERAAQILRSFNKKARTGTTLTNRQFAEALRHYGIDFTPNAAMKLFAAVDSNNSGTVDFQEFLVGVVGIPAKHVKVRSAGP